MNNLQKITRLEVIDHRPNAKEQGRIYVAHDIKVEVSIQDNNRTMKIFVTNKEVNDEL